MEKRSTSFGSKRLCLTFLSEGTRTSRESHQRLKTLYIPPEEPDLEGNSPFNAGHDLHGAKKAAYLRQISNREDALADLKSKESQLFSHI